MQKQKIFYGWWIVAACVVFTATTIPPMIALFNKFLIPVVNEMGISRSAFTLAHTISQALGIFISPFVAKKLSTGNFRRILTGGILFYCAALASFGLAQNKWHLYASAVVMGASFLCIAMIPMSMLATNWFIKKRGLAVSIIFSGIGLGGMIFSPMLTYFITHYGWRISYFLMATITLVCTVPICAFVIHRKPEDIGLLPYGAEEGATAAGNKNSGITISVKASTSTLFFKILIVATVCNGLINIGALTQFPPALEESYGPLFQAKIIALYSFFGLWGKLALGWINDRWGLVASCTAGCTAFGSSFIFMLAGGSHASMYTMAVFFGFGFAISSVSLPLVTAGVFGQEKYGPAFGLVNSAYQIGLTFGSIMTAGIYDLAGSYTLAWILLFVLTGVTLFGWIAAYVMSRPYWPGGAKAVPPDLATG